jgi:DNA-binding GntR family transcriptional regulator
MVSAMLPVADDSSNLRPIGLKPESLTSLTLEALKKAIVDKSLSPGTRVSEAMLAARLNVSKTPVREALLRLRHIGLVESVAGQLRVVLPSRESIRDAYEFRGGLEWQTTKLATERGTEADKNRIVEIAERSLAAAKAGDTDGFREADRTLHTTIARMSGNAMLAAAIEDSLLLTSALRERDIPVTGDSIDCGIEHVGIAQAIEAGRAEKASADMASHILHVMNMVLAAAPDGD